jgi:molybdate/tungstate transport system substrate-binding protein
MMPRPLLLGLCLLAGACSTGAEDRAATGARRDTVVVFAAASLSGPMKAALDTFARRTGTVVAEEHGASLELARRITELKRIPDVIALADQEVFPELLAPVHTSWYARFARNRMVVAYTDRSRGATEMDVNSWWKLLLRPETLVGRTDPELAPAGYRALLMYQLAESHYQQPGLAAQLAARTPPALLRGNAAELAALLETGELDYIIEYESLARSHDFRFVALPAAIDLGDARQAATYARATVRVKRGADSVTISGAPILYGISVPRHAPHADAGARFVAFLLGTEGRALLRRGSVDAMEMPDAVGTNVPAIVSATLRQ